MREQLDLYVLIRQGERRGLNLWRPVFEMLADGRARDTELDDKLINIARGVEVHKTGLEALAWRHLGLDLKGDKKGPDAWRTRYAELDGVPLDVAVVVDVIVALTNQQSGWCNGTVADVLSVGEPSSLTRSAVRMSSRSSCVPWA